MEEKVLSHYRVHEDLKLTRPWYLEKLGRYEEALSDYITILDYSHNQTDYNNALWFAEELAKKHLDKKSLLSIYHSASRYVRQCIKEGYIKYDVVKFYISNTYYEKELKLQSELKKV